MWERLTELLARMGILSRDLPVEEDPVADGPDDPNIEFRSLDPNQAAAAGAGAALVCPVTRKSLLNEPRFYLCGDCNTAYSVEGWAFLRETDKGRCCNCRHIGSVVPFHAGGSSQ